MTEIERQKKREVDAVQEGILRYCRNREYVVATDSKPVRNLIGDSIKPFAEAIYPSTTKNKLSLRLASPNRELIIGRTHT